MVVSLARLLSPLAVAYLASANEVPNVMDGSGFDGSNVMDGSNVDSMDGSGGSFDGMNDKPPPKPENGCPSEIVDLLTMNGVSSYDIFESCGAGDMTVFTVYDAKFEPIVMGNWSGWCTDGNPDLNLTIRTADGSLTSSMLPKVDPYFLHQMCDIPMAVPSFDGGMPFPPDFNGSWNDSWWNDTWWNDTWWNDSWWNDSWWNDTWYECPEEIERLTRLGKASIYDNCGWTPNGDNTTTTFTVVGAKGEEIVTGEWPNYCDYPYTPDLNTVMRTASGSVERNTVMMDPYTMAQACNINISWPWEWPIVDPEPSWCPAEMLALLEYGRPAMFDMCGQSDMMTMIIRGRGISVKGYWPNICAGRPTIGPVPVTEPAAPVTANVVAVPVASPTPGAAPVTEPVDYSTTEYDYDSDESLFHYHFYDSVLDRRCRSDDDCEPDQWATSTCKAVCNEDTGFCEAADGSECKWGKDQMWVHPMHVNGDCGVPMSVPHLPPVVNPIKCPDMLNELWDIGDPKLFACGYKDRPASLRVGDMNVQIVGEWTNYCNNASDREMILSKMPAALNRTCKEDADCENTMCSLECNPNQGRCLPTGAGEQCVSMERIVGSPEELRRACRLPMIMPVEPPEVIIEPVDCPEAITNLQGMARLTGMLTDSCLSDMRDASIEVEWADDKGMAYSASWDCNEAWGNMTITSYPKAIKEMMKCSSDDQCQLPSGCAGRCRETATGAGMCGFNPSDGGCMAVVDILPVSPWDLSVACGIPMSREVPAFLTDDATWADLKEDVQEPEEPKMCVKIPTEVAQRWRARPCRSAADSV